MKRVRHLFVLFLTALLITALAGCGGNSTPPPAATVTRIALSTAAGNVAAGRTVQLTATATYSNNTTGNLSGASWTSSDISIATVDANGLVTTKAPGTATITATYNGVTGTYNVTVTAAVLQSFSFSTINFSLPLGRTQSLTLSGSMSDGTAASSSTFSTCTWSSSNTGVATLSPSTGASSTVSTVATGNSTITVTCGSVVQTTTATVSPAAIVSIALTPANPSVSAGATHQFTATATMTDGTTQNVTSTATWSSSNHSYVTMDTVTPGLAHAVAAGNSTITVSKGGVDGTTLLTVTAATLQSFSFSTINFSLPLGRTQSLNLSGTMSDGSAASSSMFSNCSWSSSNTGVATLSPSTGASSTVSTVATGNSTITVTCGSVVQTTTVDVTPAAIVSIAITPASPSIDVAATQQFTATATMTDSTTQNITSTATWTSSNHSYATMDSVTPGLAHAVAAGTSTITASQGGVDGTTLLTITSTTGETPWTRLLGSTGADFGYAVARDASGNVYVTGKTSSNIDDQTMAGVSDAFVAKYNSSGTRQWVKLLGSIWDDAGRAIALDASGNVYISGYTNGDLDGYTNAGVQNTPDAFVAKYDSSGNKQWVKMIATYNDDDATGIAVDASGNIFVSGSAGIFPGLPFVGGSTDIFIAKYDSSGNRQWLSLYGSTLDDYAKGMALDSSGNIYVTGNTNTDLDGQTNAGLRDAFIAKFNSSGTKQWTRLLGTTDDDFATAVAVDGSDNVYIGGSTLGNLGGQTNAGIEDAFVAKYDSSGTRQWVKLLGTDVYDSVNGIAVDASGNVLATGQTAGNLSGQTSAGGRDAFIAKLDSAGSPQWVKLLGTNTADNASGIALGAAGNIYVVGATMGNLNGQTNAGSADAFLVKTAPDGTSH